jgi:group I intron endonuclease
MKKTIYKIELNGECYVGSTTRYKKRRIEHLTALRDGCHHSQYLQNAYNKYGEETLEFCVLEETEEDKNVWECEQKYIDMINPKYNICKIAGSAYGVKRSENTKRLIRENRMFGPDTTVVEEYYDEKRNRLIIKETQIPSFSKYLIFQSKMIKIIPEWAREIYLDMVENKCPYNENVSNMIGNTLDELSKNNQVCYEMKKGILNISVVPV